METFLKYALGGTLAILIGLTAAEFVRTSFSEAARNIREAGMHK